MKARIQQDGWTLYKKGSDLVMYSLDAVYDFRGDADVLLGGDPPHKPESTGRVYTEGGSCYPSVYDLEWRKG